MSARRPVCLAALAAALVPGPAAPAGAPVLTAVSGTNDAFAIVLTDSTGAKVTHLDAGTYTIVVHDRSTIHDFHLRGPGVDLATSEERIEDVTWRVTVSDGIYRYVCDPHAGVMRGSFAAGSVTASPPATRLNGRVGPGRTISLRHSNGSKVTVLAGIDTISLAVSDRSRSDNSPHRPGRESRQRRRLSRPYDLEPEGVARDVQVPVRQAQAAARHVRRHRRLLLGRVSPAFGPPAAAISA